MKGGGGGGSPLNTTHDLRAVKGGSVLRPSVGVQLCQYGTENEGIKRRAGRYINLCNIYKCVCVPGVCVHVCVTYHAHYAR